MEGEWVLRKRWRARTVARFIQAMATTEASQAAVHLIKRWKRQVAAAWTQIQVSAREVRRRPLVRYRPCRRVGIRFLSKFRQLRKYPLGNGVTYSGGYQPGLPHPPTGTPSAQPWAASRSHSISTRMSPPFRLRYRQLLYSAHSPAAHASPSNRHRHRWRPRTG